MTHETTEAKFTPAPWFVIAAADGETYISDSSAGFDGRTIALLQPYDESDDETDANANLIAAAPDMFVLLEDTYMGWIVEDEFANGPDHLTYACDRCGEGNALDEPLAIVHADDCENKAIADLLARARGEAQS